MHPCHWRACWRFVHWFAILLAAVQVSVAHADYLLQPGDEVEVAVLGVPDAKSTAMIADDGLASVPFAGPVQAAGLSLAAFRNLVQDKLLNRNVRRISATGQEVISAIDRDDVSVRVTAYRPIYLIGDVSKPGEQSFRPGLTVQQAVALAGGYDIMRIRMDNPFLSSADEKAQYEALRGDLAKEIVRAMRLKAEFDHAENFSPQLEGLAGDPALVQQIVVLETERFRVRRIDQQKERASLIRQVKQIHKQLDELKEQKSKEEEGVQADTVEYNTVADLYKRGSTVSTRVTDARRSLLLSSTRVLQTTALIAQLTRQSEEISRKLEKLDDDMRVEVTGELQDGHVKIEELRSRLSASSEKLVYTGMVKSQLTRQGTAAPEVVLTRQSRQGNDRRMVDETTRLEPGDFVEISLRASLFRDPRLGVTETAPGNTGKRLSGSHTQ